MAVAGIVALLVVAGIFRAGLLLPVGGIVVWFLVSVGGAIYPAAHPELHRPAERDLEGRAVPRAQHRDDALRVRSRSDRRAPVPRNRTGDRTRGRRRTRTQSTTCGSGIRSRCAMLSSRSRRSGRLFDFLDVDVDRYNIDGKTKQVMLSARELDPNKLPARCADMGQQPPAIHTWIWIHSRRRKPGGAGRRSKADRQRHTVQGPASRTDHPEIYFGEQADHYIIVDGNEPEFTPASGDENVQTKFEGGGGVKIEQPAAQGRLRVEVRRPEHPYFRRDQRQ